VPYQLQIPDALAAFGLPVEVVPGWQGRGSSAFNPGGVVCHWTAGPRGTAARPSLNVVVNGRAGLPGPLAQVYLDRRGVPVVVAAGRANHAGAGGYNGLVGNSSVFGIEAECGGDGDWTDSQRAAYPKVVAALLRSKGLGAQWALGHSEWAPRRKIDIRDWTMPAMREQVARLLGQPSPGGGSVGVTKPAADTRPRNADGSLRIAVDGVRGPATIARWQEVMATPIDGALSTPSTVVRADQAFLNGAVPAGNIRDLTGAPALAVDGREGPKTIKVRQFWLFNRQATAVLGRGAQLTDFDGIAGQTTTRLHQHALNQATARTGRY
jgi:hypothetical protein